MPRLSALSFLPMFMCTAMLSLPSQPVQAQGDSAEAPEYYHYIAPDWGVGVVLSEWGTLSESGDPGWGRDDLDWLWLSDMEDTATWPIYQVDGGTIGRDEETPNGISMTNDEFDIFFEEMLVSLSEDPTHVILESDPNHVTSDGRRWQMFHSEEFQDGGTPDDASDDTWLYYYSLFTLDDSILRLINFYYEPLGEEDDFLTALDVMLAIDPDFEGDSYDM